MDEGLHKLEGKWGRKGEKNDGRIKGWDSSKGKRRKVDKYGKGIEERGMKERKKDGSSNSRPTAEENSKRHCEKFRNNGNLAPGIYAGLT